MVGFDISTVDSEFKSTVWSAVPIAGVGYLFCPAVTACYSFPGCQPPLGPTSSALLVWLCQVTLYTNDRLNDPLCLYESQTKKKTQALYSRIRLLHFNDIRRMIKPEEPTWQQCRKVTGIKYWIWMASTPLCLSGILHVVDPTCELGLEPVSACASASVCKYISGSFPASLFQEAGGFLDWYLQHTEWLEKKKDQNKLTFC